MTAASPGVIDTFMPSTYYASEEDYLEAVGQAMRDEYRAIVDAGFILQLDCPDLAMSRQMRFGHLRMTEFLDVARMHVRRARRGACGLARDRVRLHLCWGNFAGPHNHDVPLGAIVEMRAGNPIGGVSFEAANPRHAHEWKVFRSVGRCRRTWC